jgi:dienelactone hydrolase
MSACSKEEVRIPISYPKQKQEQQQQLQPLSLDGILTIPQSNCKGIVIFAHGSGSSGRFSPRNQYVASFILNNSEYNIGTLLVDLLTEEEQKIDENTKEYRFDIKLLANRLAAITDWLVHRSFETQNGPTATTSTTSIPKIGYFGSSTGAAAALIAAAERRSLVKAIVSRGGRPDLAGSSYLKKVQSPTLFLVGSRDNSQVIALNQKALQQLKNVKDKRLVMVSGAGHLFEEPGTLEEAARHAASWFERHL